MEKSYTLGITGQMGTGKSTVRKTLQLYPNTATYDSDAIARSILQSPETKPFLLSLFGKETVNLMEESKKEFAQTVFSQPKKIRELEAFIHPKVIDDLKRRIAQTDAVWHVVESAILVRTPLVRLCEAVIVTTCSRKEQFLRLHNSRSMARNEVENRLALQNSREELLTRADYVMGTDCDWETFNQRVLHLHKWMKVHFPACY